MSFSLVGCYLDSLATYHKLNNYPYTPYSAHMSPKNTYILVLRRMRSKMPRADHLSVLSGRAAAD